MSVFEGYCQAKSLELGIQPPKRPNLYGCVVRVQRSYRYEFYGTYESTNSSPSLTPSPPDTSPQTTRPRLGTSLQQSI
jgi:hypothetical protein